jgi:hypothetical protein
MGQQTSPRYATHPFWEASHWCERQQAWRRRRCCGGTTPRIPPRSIPAARTGSGQEMASWSRDGTRGPGRRGRRDLFWRPGSGRPRGRGQADGRARVPVSPPGPGAHAGSHAERPAPEHVRADPGRPGRRHHHVGPPRRPPGSPPRLSARSGRPSRAAAPCRALPWAAARCRAPAPGRPPAPRQAPARSSALTRSRAAEGPCAAVRLSISAPAP